MADIYLGLTESGATLLPPIRWTGGEPSIPNDRSKQVDKATMLSGATRFNFRQHHPERWTLTWEMLTTAELAGLVTLNAYEVPLYFQNNWEDATWHVVAITSFEISPYIKAGPTGCRYGLSMTLEEVIG